MGGAGRGEFCLMWSGVRQIYSYAGAGAGRVKIVLKNLKAGRVVGLIRVQRGTALEFEL